MFSAAKVRTESEIILKWKTFFWLFELYRENMLIFNKLVTDFKTIFCANGFRDGQTQARGMGIFAFFVESLENEVLVQRLVDSRIANA